MKRLNIFSRLCSPSVGSQSSDVGFDGRLTVGSPSGFNSFTMLKLVSVLAILLTFGVGNAWGAEITLTNSNLGFTNTTYSTSSKTISDVTFNWVDLCKKSGETKIQAKGGSGEIWNSTVVPGKITNVTINQTDNTKSSNFYIGTVVKTTDNSSSFNTNGENSKNATSNWCQGYFHIKRSSNAAYWSSIVITYTPATITLSKSSISGLNYNVGSGPSASQTFTVSGSNIPDTLVVTAPTNFEVSLDGGSWGSSKRINVIVKNNSNAGTLSSTTVYVRLAAGKSAGSYDGNVSVAIENCNASTGVTPKTVAVSGTVTAAACDANPTIGNASLNGTFTLSSIPLQCSVSSEGGTGCSITDAGFVWKSGGTDPTISDNKTSGTYSTNITGTIPSAGSFTLGTTYKIKAYATNGNGDALSSSSFTLIPRAVIFHKNDGSATTSTQYVNDGVATALTANSFSRTGYTFNGWNTDADGTSGNNYADQANVTASSGNVDLYAKWTEKPKYTITLNAGNGTVSADGWTAGDSPTWSKTQANGDEAITFPEASCNCAGWNFVGWATSSASNAGSDPTSKTAGSTLTPASDVTYYAVYQQSTPGGTTYNKITSTGDLTTGEYVFASSSGYAMSKTVVNDRMSEKGSSYTGTSVTVSADTLRWLVVKFGSQVLIRNKNNSKFLGIDKDGYITCDDNPHLWTFTYNTTNSRWEFTSATYTSYQLIYNSYFKAGTTQSTAIYLYKQGAVTGNYYTSPSCSDYTVTASASPVAGGTVYQSTTSVTSGGKIYVYCTIHKDYNFGGWTISGTGVSPTSASTQFVEITAGSANVTATASYERKDWHVQWKVNGVELSGSDLGDAQNYYDDDEWAKVLPPNPSSCDTGDGASDVFVGWTTNTWGGKSTEPAVLFKNGRDAPYINADVTYHAVFAKESSTTYKRITSTKYIGLDSKIVIVNNSSEKALKNDYSAVDVSSNLSADDATLSSVSSDWVWTAKSQDSDGYYILKNGSKQLGINKTGGMTSSYSACGDYSTVASAWDVWEASDDSEFNTTTSNCFYLWNWATTTYYNFLTLYNSTTWESKYYANSSSKGSPTASENAMRLYIPEYTNYLISCCTEHDITLTDDGDVTGGTFETDPTSACEATEVTLTATPSNSGYVFNGWTVTNSSTSANVTTTVLGAGHANDNPATMTMPDYNVTVTAAFSAISSISVKTAPTKTVYLEGETFDPTGLVITATYANSATVDVPYSGNEAAFTFSPTTATSLTTSNTAVTITYSGQTVNQSITVYSVTLQALDENGGAIRVGGPAAPTRDGATVTKAANVDNYVYKEWVVSGATLADGANANQKIITDPTGAVTVTVKYYLPRVVKWIVNGEEWKPYTDTGSGTDGTAEVARGAQWKTLTLPTDPNPLNDEGCGDKFIGWTNAEISGQLDKDDDAAAISTLVDSNLLNSANKSGKTKTINANPYIFYAVFADYVE